MTRVRQNLFVEGEGKGHGQFSYLRDKNKAKIISLSTPMLLSRSEASVQGRQTLDNPKLAASLSMGYGRLRHHGEQSRTPGKV